MSQKTKAVPTQPRAFSFEEAITAVNNSTYLIRDLHIKDTKGRIVYTVSTTVLHPTKQTSGHLHELDDELYEFIEGTGIMMVGKLALMVKAGDWVEVEKTQFHKVINSSNSVDLIFKCYFRGKIERLHLK